MTVPARLGIVTLGVTDLARSTAFYEALGWEQCSSTQPGVIAWFRTTDTHLGLFPFHELAADANLPAERATGFGGITLAINVDGADEVEPALAAAVQAGGTLLKAATLTEWGGTSGYVGDPDGYPWEIAHNPFFPIDDEGRLHIP
jgi:catechol 2,3-dioxygenase-like lactoylglutathione lyase family enzyme